MPTWMELQQRFMSIVRRAEGQHHLTSGVIDVQFSTHHDISEVTITLGGEDIPYWSRRHCIGAFATEELAKAAVVKALEQAAKAVQKQIDAEVGGEAGSA